MLYMMSCLAVILAACYQMTTTFFSQVAHLSDESAPKPAFAITFLSVAMMFCFTAPLLTTFLNVFRSDAGLVAPIESSKWTVYAVLLGSAIVAVYAYLLLRKTAKELRGHFWPVGRSVVLAGVVVVGTVSSIFHLTFFRNSNDGIANIEFLRELAPLKDMANCKSGVAFIQFREDGGPLKYRCPTLLMFGGLTSQPFAPWPDFVDGESQELASVINDTIQAARNPSAQQ